MKTCFKAGNVPWNKGKPHPSVAGDANPMRRTEIRAAMSIKMKGRHLSEETKKKLREANLGKVESLDHRAAIGRGVANSPIYRNALLTRAVPKNDGQFRAGAVPYRSPKGLRLSPKSEFTSERLRAMWLDPDFRAKHLAALHSPESREKAFKSRRKRPTSLEAKLSEIISEARLPMKYVGDGSFWIGRKNPDFICTDGRLLAAEAAGRYWHSIGYEGSRLAYFQACGWSGLIIWEEEFSDSEAVLLRLKEFLA